MKFKSATETMATYKASMIDAKTKEFFDLQFDIPADEKQKDVVKYAENIGEEKTGHICKLLDIEKLAETNITYRIKWDVFLANAEVWKIGGRPVK